MLNWARRYLLPGLVFKSVVIGGGYGTGRELAEFFLPHGPVGGLLGMAVSMIVWSVIIALSFEFARITGSHDYRSFFKNLLGPFWVLFEILFILDLILVLSVVGAAAGELSGEALGLPTVYGTVAFMVAVVAIVFFGSESIRRVFAFWSIVLFAVYGLFLVFTLVQFGPAVGSALSEPVESSLWAWDGLRYAAYNLAVVPAVLFIVADMQSRREALGAGFFAGLIAILPAVLFYLAMLAFLPDAATAPVPVLVVLNGLAVVWLAALFKIMLFGTFIETGSGMIHAVNERIIVHLGKRRTLPLPFIRVLSAGFVLTISIVLATQIGLTALIAKGYGTLSYGFIALFIIPILTIGARRVFSTYRTDAKAKASLAS